MALIFFAVIPLRINSLHKMFILLFFVLKVNSLHKMVTSLFFVLKVSVRVVLDIFFVIVIVELSKKAVSPVDR